MCDANGDIERVLCRDWEQTPQKGPLRSALDPADRSEFERLWKALQERHAVFGGPFAVVAGAERVLMHFAGLARADGLSLIAAAESGDLLLPLLQAEADACFRAIPCHVPVRVSPSPELLAGLARVNSDLLNLHRELGKKNAE
jgi:hypothetical protein